MGITSMKRWTATLALLVLAVSAANLQAQQVKLLDFTNTFRYNQVDNLDGLGWTNRVYTDTTGNWLGGQAVLAFETAALPEPIRTTLQSPQTYNPAGHATYFRVHFNNSLGTKAFLTFSNQVDDGAVFFLNGVEIQRVRCTAAPLFLSQATGTIAAEGNWDNFTYLATNLVATDNVLAVIVVQSGTNSSDTVYGTAIWGESATITITNQPDSLTVAVNDSAAFQVQASGPAQTYQWQFRANTNVAFANIPGATLGTYSIATVNTNHAGFYRVVVTNLASAVTSAVATLTVNFDNFPPDLLSALPSDTTNTILLTFDENVFRDTGTNINNYIVTQVGTTNQLVITNAAINGKLVQLKVRPSWTTNSINWEQFWVNGSNYILRINNICDALGNVVVPNTSIGLALWKDIFSFGQLKWDYSVDGDSMDGQNWTAPSYNIATNSPAWYGGDLALPDLFWNTFDFTYSGPGTLNLQLPLGWPCYYFRSTFVLPTNSGTGIIRMNTMIDDGGVLYINGNSVYSIGLPANPTYGTLATRQRGGPPPPVYEMTPSITLTNLRSGTNYIAGELHPQTITAPFDVGVGFGVAMEAAIPPYTAPLTNGPRPDLWALPSVLPTSVATNVTFNCTLTATNIGQAAATNVQFTAVFPANVAIVTVPTGCANVVDTNGISTLTCSTNTSIGTNQVFTKVVQARSGTNVGTATIRMTVVQTPNDKQYFNNTNNTLLTITAAAQAPDIAVSTTITPSVVGISSNMNFNFTVTNLGATAASSVVAVYTNLPASMTVVTLPSGCVSGSGIVTCTIGTLNAGTAQSRTLVVRSSVAGTVTNRVVVSSTPADTVTANNVAASTATVSVKPVLGNFKPLGTTNISMTVTSVVGVTYILDYKPLLTTPTWTPVLTNAGTGGILTIVPPTNNPVSPTRFYRLRAQ